MIFLPNCTFKNTQVSYPSCSSKKCHTFLNVILRGQSYFCNRYEYQPKTYLLKKQFRKSNCLACREPQVKLPTTYELGAVVRTASQYKGGRSRRNGSSKTVQGRPEISENTVSKGGEKYSIVCFFKSN